MGFLKKLLGSPTPRPSYVVPDDLKGARLTPRVVLSSSTFKFVRATPATQLSDMFRKEHISLSKRADDAAQALADIEMLGGRFDVIVLVDGSYSMKNEYKIPTGGQHKESAVQRLVERVLGFAMQVDPDKKIPVIMYGSSAAPAVEINETNYQNAASVINPDFGSTNMADAFRMALEMAKASGTTTIIINITDGGPNSKPLTTDQVIDTASHPIFVKNLAIKSDAGPYLKKIDDLPSRIEILKDENGKPVLDSENNLVLYQNDAQARDRGDKIPGTEQVVNGDGIRVIDNVDSKAVDPYNDSDEEFMAKMVDELNTWVEVAARVGILLGVPGITQQFTLAA